MELYVTHTANCNRNSMGNFNSFVFIFVRFLLIWLCCVVCTLVCIEWESFVLVSNTRNRNVQTKNYWKRKNRKHWLAPTQQHKKHLQRQTSANKKRQTNKKEQRDSLFVSIFCNNGDKMNMKSCLGKKNFGKKMKEEKKLNSTIAAVAMVVAASMNNFATKQALIVQHLSFCVFRLLMLTCFKFFHIYIYSNVFTAAVLLFVAFAADRFCSCSLFLRFYVLLLLYLFKVLHISIHI